MSQQDFWCDHCHHRFTKRIDAPNAAVACPKCDKLTAVVTCQACGERSEIAQPNQNTQRWVCPSCKEGQKVDDVVLIEVLSAEITLPEQTTPVKFSINDKMWFVVVLIVLGLLGAYGQGVIGRSVIVPDRSRLDTFTYPTPTSRSIPATFDQRLSVNERLFGNNINLSKLGAITFSTVRENQVGGVYELNLATQQTDMLRPIYREDTFITPLFATSSSNTLYVEREDQLFRLYQAGDLAPAIQFEDIDADSLRISRDEKQFLHIENGLLHVVSLTPPISTTEAISGVISADFSPDGQQIAYSTDNKLFIHRNGESRLVLDRKLDPLAQLRWSPDGQYIGSIRQSVSLSVFVVINAETGETRQMPNAYVRGVYGWSPDGRYIVGAMPELTIYDVAEQEGYALFTDELPSAIQPVWRE